MPESPSKTCPGCSSPLTPDLNHRTIKLHPSTQLAECTGCGGLIGTVDERDLPSFLIMDWELGSYEQDEARYFDLMVVGPSGVGRTHGWYLPRTKRVVQFG